MRLLLRFFIIGAVVAAPLMSSAATFIRPLSVGSRGADVTSLQEILATAGYFKVSATGYFGVITRKAVIDFQKASGLEQVGIVGPKTRALLNGMSAVPATPSVPTITELPTPPAPPAPPTATTSAPETSAPTSSTNTVVATTTTDTDALVVTIVSPSSVIPRNSFFAILSVTTNRKAACRFDTMPDREFKYMTQFVDTNSTTHSYTLNSLSPDALYIYYVRCEDAATLIMSKETTVTFSVTGT